MRTFIPIVLDIGFIARIDVDRVGYVSVETAFRQPRSGPYRGLRAERLSTQPRYLSGLVLGVS